MATYKQSGDETERQKLLDQNGVNTTYQESDAVIQAQQALQNQQASKPGQYQSQYQSGINDLLGQIQNRPKFQYDVNADALYQQAAQNYMQQGQLAMMDTMGQAAALTGGYGNSYAQTAGQQQYNNYLRSLTEMIPQFQQMAMEQYQMEGDQLMDQYNLMLQQEEMDYGRYQDSLDQYYAELDRAQAAYDSERDYDYSRFADDRDFGYGQYMDERNYQYQQERDQIGDEQWQKEYEESVRRWNHENGISTGSSGSSGGSSSGSGSGSPGGGEYNNGGYSADVIKQAQAYVGASQDGVWGPASEAAAANAGFQSLSDVVKRLQGGTDSDKLTYSDVALTAAQMSQKGATKNDIYQYLSSVVNSSNYQPTNSAKQDLNELRSSYVGSGR